MALTGRFLLRSGFTVHHDAALYRGGGLDPQREITFARPLRAAGYATGMFGKWQINNLYDEPDVFQEAAYDFIRRHKDRPFLLYLPSPLTHGWTFTDPVTPTPLNTDADRPHEAMYRDMIRYADRLVGGIVDQLRDQGILERTIIFAGADNGSETSTITSGSSAMADSSCTATAACSTWPRISASSAIWAPASSRRRAQRDSACGRSWASCPPTASLRFPCAASRCSGSVPGSAPRRNSRSPPAPNGKRASAN